MSIRLQEDGSGVPESQWDVLVRMSYDEAHALLGAVEYLQERQELLEDSEGRYIENQGGEWWQLDALLDVLVDLAQDAVSPSGEL